MIVVNKPSNEIPINMSQFELEQLMLYYKNILKENPNNKTAKNMITTIHIRLA